MKSATWKAKIYFEKSKSQLHKIQQSIIRMLNANFHHYPLIQIAHKTCQYINHLTYYSHVLWGANSQNVYCATNWKSQYFSICNGKSGVWYVYFALY